VTRPLKRFEIHLDLPNEPITDSNFRNEVNFSSARLTKRFPLSRCASAIQIVRPLESIADTQPQLQPALLRLSEIISQLHLMSSVAPFRRIAWLRLYRSFGASEATIFSNRGSPRRGSQKGNSFKAP